ncbi:MAG: SpoVG family protein [Planctomycetes bacterium]|nr:SpoVG family protein [Planctomycetota bacterium]
MEVTEVRIKLMEDSGERLQAFCSITLDNCFVIRDLKIIEGPNGAFVAMPSRKLAAHCPQCRCKNHLRASYCNQCGLRLNPDRIPKSDDGRVRLYADIAHPINSSCREAVQARIIEAFHAEVERSKQAGYVSSYEDFEEEFVAVPHGTTSGSGAPREPSPRRELRTGDAAKVDAAESQPRGPHRPPVARNAPTGTSAPQQADTPAPSPGVSPPGSSST